MTTKTITKTITETGPRPKVFVFVIVFFSLLASPLRGAAQNDTIHLDSLLRRTIHLHIPSVLCPGQQLLLNLGNLDTFAVVITNGKATLGHSERIFLPDGVPCGEMGCSYTSPVTFTDFPDTSIITSAEDIHYVRVNMEHSWVGDIYIKITCPNGQESDLLRYGGTGSSSCLADITSEHRGWNTGYSNVAYSTYLGVPIDQEDNTNRCDSTAEMNQPGIGWNYCWSNNTTMNYTYGPIDGLIYRSGNRIGSTIDSSDVAAGSHFYHPDESFDSLVGCPLNGTWQIVVIDGWSIDNGYIFSWEIALNPEQIEPDTCIVTSYQVTGDFLTNVDSNSYLITLPDSLNTDTLLSYSFHITTSCGDIFDTTVTLHVHPSYAFSDTIVACHQHIFPSSNPITTDTDTTIFYVSQFGCDSIGSYHVDIYDSVVITIDTEIGPIDLPFHFINFHLYPSLIPSFHSNFIDTTVRYYYFDRRGCDSIIHFHLTLHLSDSSHVDSTVCDNQLPITWNGVVLDTSLSISSDSGDYSTIDTLAILTNRWGADSTVTLHLVILPTFFADTYDTIVENQLPWHRLGQTFVDDADTVITIPSLTGQCDSIYHYHLFVYPNIFDTVLYYACSNALPVVYDSFSISHDTLLNVTYSGIHGEDSTVTFFLHILHDSDTTIIDSVLENQLPWFFFDTLFNDTVSNHPFHLFNEAGCDSVIYYSLYVFWDGDHCDTSLVFPTLVTPNGDGINDRFVIGGLLENNCFKFNDLLIYDRTGHLVYHGHNIARDEDFWDPAAHRAPDATYFYVFKAHGVTIHTMHQGLFEVLR